MWRERPAIDFIRKDNPKRILEVKKFEIELTQDKRLVEIVKWAKETIPLPEVDRKNMTEEVASSFNIPTGKVAGLQLPERKSNHSDWYEIVRLEITPTKSRIDNFFLSSNRNNINKP
ncbi:MAG: hypothetical protein IPO69_22265 [Saprospiraceae bacterium]|nr:hypothetical protein [Saprospiraceae bacterium]